MDRESVKNEERKKWSRRKEGGKKELTFLHCARL